MNSDDRARSGGCGVCAEPAGLADRPYTYLKTVQGVCRECHQVVNCRILVEDGRVWQERLCPEHGPSRALIAEDHAWYLRATRTPVEPRPPGKCATAHRNGCPLDCGPCPFHAAAPNLPVFSVTNACNLACPICFTYNRRDRSWHMPLDEVDRVLDQVLEAAGDLDLINITGGEPTLHPQILELLRRATSRPRIGRVTLNSNGLRIAKDDAFVRELARLGVYVILSFDTFDPARSKRIHGADIVQTKLEALAKLNAHGVGATLLNVMIRDTNDDEIGRVLELAAQTRCVRSVTIQTMTYTGQGGKDFPRGLHMTIDGAQKAIERSTGGRLRFEDFHPMPAAHPLCYGIGYFFKTGEAPLGLVPFRRLFSEEEMRKLLGGNYLIRPGDDFNEMLDDAIHRLWAREPEAPELGLIRRLAKKLYPQGRAPSAFQRQRLAEEHVLTVYIHAHMDEDNFDLSRVSTCPDLVPDVSGTLIPACSYNVFYRMRDARFWVTDGEK
ncbi:MAG: radical SAM protein [Candidatus Riflebacteria bacterium]|nr:radical SAM protein [Candidatus Riflebacteria bacterium]